MALMAATVKVYEVPFVSPETTAVVVLPLTIACPDGEPVTL
jgi:hypothetical protein